jgi:SAM-dependent methyltransferase
MARFVPKQALPVDAKTYAEILGDGTQNVAHQIMSYISPFPEGSIVHDNACGQGVVSKAIMSQSPISITIHATDIWPKMVEVTNSMASKNSWPIESATIASEDLTFTDDFFTHTVMNFGIHMVKSSTSAAFQIYRTLKPGGTAIFTVWADKIFIKAVTSGHERTRPAGISPPPGVTKHWMELEQIYRTLQDAGFDQKNFRYETVATSIEVKSSRRWAEIVWSFMGALDPGWVEEDEVRWDEAVDAIQKALEEWNGFEKKDGVAKLTMQAHVVIVTR